MNRPFRMELEEPQTRKIFAIPPRREQGAPVIIDSRWCENDADQSFLAFKPKPL